MDSSSLKDKMKNPWGAFVKWLAAPAEAEANRLGLDGPDNRNAFGHAYTAARMVYGVQEAPIYQGRPAAAADLIDFLGRQKENLPGIFDQQNDFRDYYRDLLNNGIGIDIGNYARQHLYSHDELGKLVKDAMDDGTIISSLDDSRIPARPSSGYLTWPMPSPPQYQGPSATYDSSIPPRAIQPSITDQRSSVFEQGAPPLPFFPPAAQNAPRGLPGMMVEAGLIDPSNPDQPPSGGLPGLIQEWMRNNQIGGATR